MATARLTPKEFHESGLLYHVNETALWPLGLALAVDVDPVTGEYQPGLLIIDRGEVIQDPDPEIRARANVWLAERFRTVKP
jgi:hypothetical protein